MCLLQVLIGNAYYNCSCVRYVWAIDVWVIVGVSVGCGALAIIVIMIVIIVIVVKCRRRRRRNKPKEERDTCNDSAAAGCVELYEDDRYYSTIGLPAAHATDNTYSRPLPAEPDDNQNKEYSTLGPAEPEGKNDDDTPYYLSLKTDDEC